MLIAPRTMFGEDHRPFDDPVWADSIDLSVSGSSELAETVSDELLEAAEAQVTPMDGERTSHSLVAIRGSGLAVLSCRLARA